MTGWLEAPAPAKINLALLVGPVLPHGKHEVATVLLPLELADTVRLRRARATCVTGFAEDTLVGGILAALTEASGHAAGWEVEIEKRIPVAAGLGGGSADAAVALRLANATLPRPLADEELHRLAAAAGADVPFFLAPGPKLGTGDGSTLEAVDVPTGYAILLAVPHGAVKESTGAVYRAFDERGGERGFEERRRALLDLLGRGGADLGQALAGLPPNDLASSPLAGDLVALGAFRADVSGAGPTVYGLFEAEAEAERAGAALAGCARDLGDEAAPRLRLESG